MDIYEDANGQMLPEHATLIDQVLRRWEDAKSARLPYEDDWRFIAKWCAPRRLDEEYTTPGEALSLRLTDTTAVDAGERFAALLFGYLFGGREPFAVPRLMSRDKTSHAENVWLDEVRDKMQQVFRSSDVTFRSAMMQTLFDQQMFGTGNVWTGSRLGSLPQYKSTTLFDFWFVPGEDGKPEAGFRRFRLTAHAAFAKWRHPKLAKIAQEHPAQRLSFLTAVWPRATGRKGAPAKGKPFAEYTIGIDEKIFLDESGYERMPFSVGRFHLRPGEVYGMGCGHKAAPISKWLNRLYEAAASGAEKAIDPPIFDMTNGAFPDFDRRAGAVNMGTFDALGFSNVKDALQTIGPSGDFRPGIEILNMGRQTIQTSFYIDWMESGGGAVRTATEVLDQRDLRFKSLSGFFADTENNLAGPVIDITFKKLQEYGAFSPMPETLANELLDFEFRSPLAAAMEQGDVESMVRTLDLARNLGEFDPSVIDKIDGDAMLNQGADDYGLKRSLLRADDEVEAIRKKREQDAQDAQELAQAQAGASALQAGGQGIASLENAGNTGGQQ